jgi:hypothetical protein
MTAVLDAGPGAVISHASAGALWRLPGFALLDVAAELHPARLERLRVTEDEV